MERAGVGSVAMKPDRKTKDNEMPILRRPDVADITLDLQQCLHPDIFMTTAVMSSSILAPPTNVSMLEKTASRIRFALEPEYFRITS